MAVLTVINQWLTRNEGKTLGDKTSVEYLGVHEDENGSEVGGAIGRYRLEHRSTPRQISTLQFIIDHLTEFYPHDIQLPEAEGPEQFCDIFVHASQSHIYRGRTTSAIFWGKVESDKAIALIDGYICIGFGYKTHCLYFILPEENLSAKGMSVDNLIGKYVAIAEKMIPSERFQELENNVQSSLFRPCSRVGNKSWGGFAIFNDEVLKFFMTPVEAEWIDPILYTEQDESFDLSSEENLGESTNISEANSEEIHISDPQKDKIIQSVFNDSPEELIESTRLTRPRESKVRMFYRQATQRVSAFLEFVADAAEPIRNAIEETITWILSKLGR